MFLAGAEGPVSVARRPALERGVSFDKAAGKQLDKKGLFAKLPSIFKSALFQLYVFPRMKNFGAQAFIPENVYPSRYTVAAPP